MGGDDDQDGKVHKMPTPVTTLNAATTLLDRMLAHPEPWDPVPLVDWGLPGADRTYRSTPRSPRGRGVFHDWLRDPATFPEAQARYEACRKPSIFWLQHDPRRRLTEFYFDNFALPRAIGERAGRLFEQYVDDWRQAGDFPRRGFVASYDWTQGSAISVHCRTLDHPFWVGVLRLISPFMFDPFLPEHFTRRKPSHVDHA